jgi:hypothetical protein
MCACKGDGRISGVSSTTLWTDGSDFEVLVDDQAFESGCESDGSVVFACQEAKADEYGSNVFQKEICAIVRKVELQV